MRLGYHMPTSGGYTRQLSIATEIGAECLQVFVGSPTTWRMSAPDAAALGSSADLVRDAGIFPLVVHGAYLINMASKDEDNFRKSHDLIQESLHRASLLRAPYLVIHVGSHGGAGLEYGYERISEMLESLRTDWPDDVCLLLENTAGSGNTIGSSFQELGEIRRRAGDPPWIGICLDTCHAFSAGYPVNDSKGWRETLDIFDAVIGLSALKILHLNDSLTPFASRKDRHANIGEGSIGVGGFRAMMTMTALVGLPGILETPDNGDYAGYRRDISLLKQLRLESA